VAVSGASVMTDQTKIILALMMSRRQALLLELSAVEDFLIGQGCLARRSMLTRRERKVIGVDHKSGVEYNID
jgi:hypothetical protein